MCIIYIHVVSEMMIHCEHGDFGVACIFANNPTWRFPEMRATPKKSSIYNLYMDFPYFSMLLPTCWGSIDRNQVCHWDTEDWPCMAVGFCLVVSGRPDGAMNSPSQWAQKKGAELLIHMYVDNMCIYIYNCIYTYDICIYLYVSIYIIIYIHAYIRIYIYYYTQYIHHMYPKLRGGWWFPLPEESPMLSWGQCFTDDAFTLSSTITKLNAAWPPDVLKQSETGNVQRQSMVVG